MSNWRNVLIGLVLIALPIAALAWAATREVTIANPGFDASSALVFMTSAAVGIERLIEGLWGLLNTKWPWWPMSALSKAVEEFESTTKTFSEDHLDPLEAGLAAAVDGLAAGSAAAIAAKQELQAYRYAADSHVELPPSLPISPRLGSRPRLQSTE